MGSVLVLQVPDEFIIAFAGGPVVVINACFAFEPHGFIFKIDGSQHVFKNVQCTLIVNRFESDFRRYDRAGIMYDIGPFFPVVENEMGTGKCTVTNISEAKAR